MAFLNRQASWMANLDCSIHVRRLTSIVDPTLFGWIVLVAWMNAWTSGGRSGIQSIAACSYPEWAARARACASSLEIRNFKTATTCPRRIGLRILFSTRQCMI